jgi:nucleoside-diphosphate-sugar epimerase
MDSVMITGGLGFLGSYCVDRYAARGWSVTVIDNLSSNAVGTDHPGIDEMLVMDVLDYDWEEGKRFDLVMHLASPVGPAGILKHAGRMAGYILDDTYWAMEGAMLNSCRLVFVSTSEIYGYREMCVTLAENDDKLLVGDFKVRNEYAIAKLLAEIVISNTAKISDLDYQIVRPFNISGARQQPAGGFVLPTFVRQALKGDPITVFGDGEQIRAFTHAEDIITGIVMTAESGLQNEIWNVGNIENKTTIQNLAETVKSMTGSGSPIVHVDPKTIHGPLYEEAWDKVPDAGKISRELGWAPTKGIEEIVENAIEYWKEQFNAEAAACDMRPGQTPAEG